MRLPMPVLLVVLSVGLWISPGAVDSEEVLSVRRVMTASEFRAAGLSKLTQSESAALDAWLVRYTDTLLRAATARPETHATSENRGYAVEVAHNDELFMINGEKFMAKIYCFNVEEGDRVIFIEGSPLGVCVTATFVNLRTNDKCEVWCE